MASLDKILQDMMVAKYGTTGSSTEYKDFMNVPEPLSRSEN